MTAIPFVTLAEPRYGEAVQVSPAITRVVAHNPSKFTYHGTGTYIVGAGRDVVVIDPGPRLDGHRDALAAALASGGSIPEGLLQGDAATFLVGALSQQIVDCVVSTENPPPSLIADNEVNPSST